MKEIKKDPDVMFDFILEKMLKIDERILFADRKLVYLEPNDENAMMYHIITLDSTGTVRKYAKECKPLHKWTLIETM